MSCQHEEKVLKNAAAGLSARRSAWGRSDQAPQNERLMALEHLRPSWEREGARGEGYTGLLRYLLGVGAG